MSRSVSPSSDKLYGLSRVCRIWGASCATIHRHLSPARPQPPQRPGPVGPMPDAALLTQIRATLTGSPSTERATARSGRDCACAACAPPSAGCCA